MVLLFHLDEESGSVAIDAADLSPAAQQAWVEEKRSAAWWEITILQLKVQVGKSHAAFSVQHSVSGGLAPVRWGIQRRLEMEAATQTSQQMCMAGVGEAPDITLTTAATTAMEPPPPQIPSVAAPASSQLSMWENWLAQEERDLLAAKQRGEKWDQRAAEAGGGAGGLVPGSGTPSRFRREV